MKKYVILASVLLAILLAAVFGTLWGRYEHECGRGVPSSLYTLDAGPFYQLRVSHVEPQKSFQMHAKLQDGSYAWVNAQTDEFSLDGELFGYSVVKTSWEGHVEYELTPNTYVMGEDTLPGPTRIQNDFLSLAGTRFNVYRCSLTNSLMVEELPAP